MQALVLFALVAACRAAAVIYAPALAETGASTQYRSQDNYGNYNFGYDEGHLSGGTFRREAGDAHGNVAGSYGLRDADGRVRVVNYVADANGFRADIKSNEPGVEPKDPASTLINKTPVVVAAPAVAYAAPAVAYSAPVPHYAHAAPLLHYGAPALHYGAVAHHPLAAPHYGFGYHY